MSNLEKKKEKLEVAMPGRLPIWNLCRNIQSASWERYPYIPHEVNLSVLIHFPRPHHKNIPLQMTFLIGSFSKETKGRWDTENLVMFNLQSTLQRSSMGELLPWMAHKKGTMQARLQQPGTGYKAWPQTFLDLPPDLPWSAAEAFKQMITYSSFFTYLSWPLMAFWSES